MDANETPEVGTKCKVYNQRGVYAFHDVADDGSSWWFISVSDGKFHAFKPEDVYEAGTKKKRQGTRREKKDSGESERESVPTYLRVEMGREGIEISLGDETINVI